MNYSKLSDDKINLQVFERLFGNIGEDRDMLRVWQQGKFQPCNSWADAGPIIQEYLIALKPVPLYVGGYRWFATEGDGLFGLKAADNNPLRAAMMLFLAMQEKANA